MLSRRRLLQIVMLLQKLILKVDDDDDVQALMYTITLRAPRRSLFSLWARKKLLEFRRIEESQRLSISGFVSLVWRYPDIQFKEDFRMTREMFEVNYQCLFAQYTSVQ